MFGVSANRYFTDICSITVVTLALFQRSVMNRVRWVVLCLSQDGACTESFENFRDISLKGGLSNNITLNPPLFSLENTFKLAWFGKCVNNYAKVL